MDMVNGEGRGEIVAADISTYCSLCPPEYATVLVLCIVGAVGTALNALSLLGSPRVWRLTCLPSAFRGGLKVHWFEV